MTELILDPPWYLLAGVAALGIYLFGLSLVGVYLVNIYRIWSGKVTQVYH